MTGGGSVFDIPNDVQIDLETLSVNERDEGTELPQTNNTGKAHLYTI